MNAETRKLLRRAQRGPDHARESRKLRAALPPTPRASFDPGFVDGRIPGTLLEVSLAPGASLQDAPMESLWIAHCSGAWVDTASTPTILAFARPLPRIMSGTHAGRVRFIVGALWRLIGRAR
jgi:hypothetical protein